MMGSGRAKELCAADGLAVGDGETLEVGVELGGERLHVSQLGAELDGAGQFMRMLRMAWVAHALVITWLAKKTPLELASSSTGALGVSPLRYLKRKIRPYTGLRRRKRGRRRQSSSRGADRGENDPRSGRSVGTHAIALGETPRRGCRAPSTWTPFTPISWMSSVKTPGSLSMVVHSIFADPKRGCVCARAGCPAWI